MCGIAGIYSFANTANLVSREELRATRDHMFRRGPDASGEWFSRDGRVAFGHRRLSIIDLSERASQPMLSNDGKLVICFNGEIYNYLELKAELERDGSVFRTTSDTEVLLHLYARHGESMLQRLRGMFAFAIWDENRRGLFLARDPYGIKPLYYSTREGVFRFASQVRALLAGGAVSRAIDPAGQTGFFLWGSVPEPLTFYRDISALPAGHAAWLDAEGMHHVRPYYSVAAQWEKASLHPDLRSESTRAEGIASALRDSVRHHLIADVPVGVFLSGGVDSGALVGMMREQHSGQITGTTLRFEEFGGRSDDEVPYAAELARCYGVAHSVRNVSHAEFVHDLPAIFAAMDQPSIDGVNSWFISKASAELGLKVAVSGLGGDELFGGYSSFIEVPRIARLGRVSRHFPTLSRALRSTLSPLLAGAGLHPKMAGVFELSADFESAYLLKRGLFMPWELDTVLPADVVTEGLAGLRARQPAIAPMPELGFAAVAALEAERYMRNQLLRDTDWASMAHSLEVRVPLVDAALLSEVGALVLSGFDGPPKKPLAQAPRPPLPASVLNRPKTGFSTPVQQWLETSSELDVWRRVGPLTRKACPWARRFAYTVADAFQATS